MLVLTAKLQILPSPEQQELLRNTMRMYTDACNFVSAHIFETKDTSQSSLHKALYYNIRSAFGLGAQMAQSVLISFTAVSYDSSGKAVLYPGRHTKRRRAQYAKTRKELQQRQTPSARRRLLAIGSRESRWMSDINHQVSKALVESQPAKTLFVLEDLTGIRGATERVKIKNRYVTVSWSFFDLRKMIEYKAVKRGSKVIAVPPRYTSQTCPKCGHTERANRNKTTHTFQCKTCGYISNDDRIGAMNLHRKGIEYLSAVAHG